MYTIGYSHQNNYCSPSTGTMYTFGVRNKAITNKNSTAQYHFFGTNTYDNRAVATQMSHSGPNAYDYIDLTAQDVRFGTVTFSNTSETAHDSHDTNEPKITPYEKFDSSESVGEYSSAGSSISRILDDAMSIDTFPCVLVPLTTEDKIVNWLDIPLDITCIHSNSNVDDEEISVADSCQVDAKTRESSRMAIHLFTPVTNTFHRQGEWHFDIDSVESDEMSIDTVKTWSLSEDFS